MLARLVVVRRAVGRVRSQVAQALSGQSAFQEYKVGNVSIRLPGSHRLPIYQRQNPLYDRFLPFLAEANSGDEWIVDVGANVGDTCVALASKCANPILAVEGSTEFFPLLTQNIGRARAGLTIANAIVGTGAYSGELRVSSSTTASMEAVSGSAPATVTSLDNLLVSKGIPHERVSLLKTDTDGFDADVLMSAKSILRASRPLLFWENEFRSPQQLQELERLYSWLAEIGYENFWVFDNFGALVAAEVDLALVRQLNRYLDQQRIRRATRTIYYLDILSATSNRLPVAREAVDAYLRWIGDNAPHS